MSVLYKMLSIRAKFENKDRQDVMNVLVFLLSYEDPFRIGNDDTFVLFRNENDLSVFCTNNEVKIPAMKKIFADMRTEGLIALTEYPVIITSLGWKDYA